MSIKPNSWSLPSAGWLDIFIIVAFKCAAMKIQKHEKYERENIVKNLNGISIYEHHYFTPKQSFCIDFGDGGFFRL